MPENASQTWMEIVVVGYGTQSQAETLTDKYFNN